MNTFDDLLGKMTEFLRAEMKTDTIIGEQFQLGEFTCVPVMSIGLGFGGGGGEGKGNAMKNGEGEGSGVGGGAGMGMGPVGFLVTRGSEIEFIPTRSSKGLGAAFEKLPHMLDRFMEHRRKKDDAKD